MGDVLDLPLSLARGTRWWRNAKLKIKKPGKRAVRQLNVKVFHNRNLRLP